jgi:hypothetical protein
VDRREFLLGSAATIGAMGVVPATAFGQVSLDVFIDTLLEFGEKILASWAAGQLVAWVDEYKESAVVRTPPATFAGQFDAPYQFTDYNSYFMKPTIVADRVMAVGGLPYVVKNNQQPSYVTSLNGPEMVGIGDRRNTLLWSQRGTRLPVTVSDRAQPSLADRKAFAAIYGAGPDLKYVRQFCGCDGPLTGFGYVNNPSERGRFDVVTTWA